jgi:hypothetical protein
MSVIDVEHLDWIARFLLGARGGRGGALRGELREVCERLGAALPAPRVIRNVRDEPYLERHYLLGGPEDLAASFDARGAPLPGVLWAELPVELYVHHLRASDERGVLHSHPWAAAASLILAGGYREDRRDGDRVVTRDVAPLEVNVLREDDFHRLDLVEADAWSFFVAGPATRRWHFWDPLTGAVTSATRRPTDRRGSRAADPQAPTGRTTSQLPPPSATAAEPPARRVVAPRAAELDSVFPAHEGGGAEDVASLADAIANWDRRF